MQLRPDRWRCASARAGQCPTREFQLRNIDIVSARQLAQWVRSVHDWNIIYRECRYELAEYVLSLQGTIANNQRRIDQLLDAIEAGTHSFQISAEIPNLEQTITHAQTELSVLARDPTPLPTSHQLRRRLEPLAQSILQQVNIPEYRERTGKKLATLFHHIDMCPGDKGRRSSSRIRPHLLHLAFSVRDP